MNSYDILYYCGSCEMLNVFRLQNILWTLLFILEVQILNSLSCLFLFVTLIQGAYIKGLLWARPELIISDPKGKRHSSALSVWKNRYTNTLNTSVSAMMEVFKVTFATGYSWSTNVWEGYICRGFIKEMTLERCIATCQGTEGRTFHSDGPAETGCCGPETVSK